MGIKVTIEVGTVQELDYVMSNWKSERGRITMKTTSGVSTPMKDPEGLKKLFKQIKQHPKQLVLLQALYENPQGMSDDELRTKLSIKTGNALGGTLSGLTWQAKKLGLHGRDIVSREEKEAEDGEDYYFYRLTPEMVEVMKQAQS